MAAATKTHGIEIAYDTVGGSTFSDKLADIMEVEPPMAELDDIETTTIEDGVDEVNTYEPGNEEGGELTVTLRFAKAQTTTVEGIKGVKKSFRVTYADGSKRVFTGYLKGLGEQSETKGIVKQRATFKVSGKTTFTAAS